MDDFRRPPINRAPGVRPAPTPTPTPTPVPMPAVVPNPATQPTSEPGVDLNATATAPIPPQPIEAAPQPSPKKRRRTWLWWLISIVSVVVLAMGATYAWYTVQLSPVDKNNTQKVAFTVEKGSTTDSIAKALEKEGLIRSAIAFVAYTKVDSSQGSLKAGSYRLSPSESVQEIYGHLTKGMADTFDITFLPGGTVMDNKKVLLNAGYDKTEIDEAFSATYDSPLFEGRKAGQDIEGFIWGDTYKMGVGASVKDILRVAFDEYYKLVQKDNLVAGFEKHGLTLYEGITLASIIQRESGNGKDDAQIAQVFYTRMKMDMMLGSDVTYQYIADKQGIERRIDLDSPYNTRRYVGLPPGPIATPGVDALRAVANPAPGDYLYFLSGDDDVTYFGRTLQEHERNIIDHCAKKCQII